MAQEEQYTLHQMRLSGNSYKIRLTAALLGTHLKLISYDTLKNETRTPEFLSKVNRHGRVPVLQIDSTTFLPESNAACHYLASSPDSRTRNGGRLIPDGRLEQAEMLRWMFFEQYSHEPSVAVLRYWRHMVGEANLTDLQKQLLPEKEKQAVEVLDVMEEHLQGREWFVGDGVSLADVCLFAYTHRLGESGLDVKRWPGVEGWVGRVAGLEGFVKFED